MTTPFKQFTEVALKTESVQTELRCNPAALMLVLDACRRTSEILDKFKKAAFYGKPLDGEQVNEDIGAIVQTLAVVGIAAEDGVLNDPDAGVQGVSFGMPDSTEEERFPLSKTSFNMRVAHGIIGGFTESGEMVKALIEGTMTGIIDKVNLQEEIGDFSWYLAILMDELGLTLEECLAKVTAKLEKRYASGKFTAVEAITRNLAVERAALEGVAE